MADVDGVFFLGVILGALTVVGAIALLARGRSGPTDELDFRRFDGLPVGVLVVAADGSVRHLNSTLRGILGVDPDTTIEHTADLAALNLIDIDGAPVPLDEQPIARALRGETGADSVLGRDLPRASRRWFLINTAAVPGVEPGELLTIATFADISGRMEALSETMAEASQLRHQALYDGLTGLPNRTLLMDRMSKADDRARRRHTATALLVLDMDGFKAVNDTLGHAVGDEVLVQVALRLRSALRDVDTAVRLGGDEFVVLCEGLDPASAETAATMIAARMRNLLNQPFMTTSGSAATAASLGMAIAPPGTPVDLSLLRRADATMLAAKRERDGVRTQHSRTDNSSDAGSGAAAASATTQQHRVFIVDDDAAMRLLASRIIDVSATMTVVGEAADGVSAITQILKVNPDIVLCDVMMPGTSGPEVVRGVRAVNPDQLFAFWSATTVNELEKHYRSLGVPYVEKDRIEELPTRLAEVMAGLGLPSAGKTLDKTA